MKKDAWIKARGSWVVLVTAPSVRVARVIARALLGARLAACVNLVPRLESHYWWRDKLETSAEVLLVVKTTAALVEPLAEAVRQHHPYDTPEIVAWPLAAGSRRYLDWLQAAVRPPARRTPARPGR